nr:retrovirus-related Pol polyprotein from transposon TNT 1-94 [Tanacetum cinerariifolium]
NRGEETISEDMASVVVEITMMKGNNKTGFNKIIMEEDMMTVEEAVHMIAIISGHFARDCRFPKRVKETMNLVTKEDVTVDGIVMMAYEVYVDGTVMMANEEVVLEIETTWYLDTATMKEGSEWGQQSKNVFHGQQHEHGPQNLAYWPRTNYERGECLNSTECFNSFPANQTLNDEDELKSLQNLYDSANKMHFVCHKADSESVSLEKAVRGKKWKVAMDEEITSIEMNETCDSVELPKGHQPIRFKWVFSKKTNTQGEVERHKARLIATGKVSHDYS